MTTAKTDLPDFSSAAEFPQAQIRPRRRWSWSYVWMLPVIAILAASWLMLNTWQQQRTRVTIRFQNGYGLKPGDALRYRGIDAGRVEEVRLTDNLDSVWVAIRLIPSAADLARNGSRFWIARPQLDITGISGLDTVVGANYLTLLPGLGEPQYQFNGLEQPPFADMREPGGMEIVLTTPGKGSLKAGTPISYRQVIIGHLMTVDLARDASTVEAKAYIKPDYINLIRENIKFWRTSAARVSAGISGFSLDVDSVHSLILGGINLAIPPQPGKTVEADFHFRLYDKPEDEWLDWIPGLSLYDENDVSRQSRPYLINARRRWSYRDWVYWKHDIERHALLLPLKDGLLGPADVLLTPDDAIGGSVKLWIDNAPAAAAVKAYTLGNGLAILALEHDYPIWSEQKIRQAGKPEDSLILADIELPTRFVGADRYRIAGDSWIIDPELPFDGRWHGAAVMAESDGALLGLVLIDDDDVKVVPVPAAAITTQIEETRETREKTPK